MDEIKVPANVVGIHDGKRKKKTDNERTQLVDLYKALSEAIETGRAPIGGGPFNDRFYACQPPHGPRVILEGIANNCVRIVPREVVGYSIAKWSNEGAPGYNFLPRQLSGAVEYWLANAPSVPMPKPWAELSDPDLTFSRLPWDLDIDSETAPTPLFDEMLGRFSNSAAIRCFIGSLFYPESDRQQYLWIYGDGDNGKGALAWILKKALGESYASRDAAKAKDSAWFTGGLIGKRLVVFPECNHFSFPMTAICKSVTGGDRVECERKYESSFDSELSCKLVFMSNEQPDLTSQKANLRRVIYSECETFKGEGNESYKGRLWEEARDFLIKCKKDYIQSYPNHGRIQCDTEAVEMLAESNECHFEKFFTDHFEPCPIVILENGGYDLTKGHAVPGEVMSAFKNARILNPREQHSYLRYANRRWGVKMVRVRVCEGVQRNVYMGMRRTPIWPS